MPGHTERQALLRLCGQHHKGKPQTSMHLAVSHINMTLGPLTHEGNVDSVHIF